MSYRQTTLEPAYTWRSIVVICLAITIWLALIFSQPEPTVELKLSEWHCVTGHVERDNLVVIIDGIPVKTPSSKSVCDHWIRRQKTS